MIACETMKNGLMVFDSNDNNAGVKKKIKPGSRNERFCKRKKEQQ